MSDTVSIQPKTLVVVADGHQAILFRSIGVKDAMSLSEEQRLTPKNLSDEGPSGSRPEDQTEKQTDEATFSKQLAHALKDMKNGNKYEHMVLVADPQTLGQLRNAMDKNVANSIILSLDKGLTNHSVEDIAKIVRNAAG